MIAPVIPPQTPWQEQVHGPDPARRVPPVADRDVWVGVSRVAEGGRVTDKPLLDRLGWTAPLRLAVEYREPGVLLARPDTAGAVRVSPSGYFRVPYRLRRPVFLSIGDRVLLLSRRGADRLLICPPTALAQFFAEQLAGLQGQGR
ncbi:hypothetical protein [Nocardia fusca]|uniref:hypothetical protein n=1 Tax=Nocardia fusca TaxID=941183 RepID=UPI0007A748D4|nr:hypothetical protein [Nocardia fusca]